jgi:hypothetical protein
VKRAEFIDALADSIAKGRKRNFPDMRPSEAAVARMGDQKKAASLWRKHRAKLSTLTLEEFIDDLNKGPGSY